METKSNVVQPMAVLQNRLDNIESFLADSGMEYIELPSCDMSQDAPTTPPEPTISEDTAPTNKHISKMAIMSRPYKARDYYYSHYPKEIDLFKKAYFNCTRNTKSYREEFIEIANLIASLNIQPYLREFGQDFGPHCIWVNLPKAAVFNSFRGKVNKKTLGAMINNWTNLVNLNSACDSADDYTTSFINQWWRKNVEKVENIKDLIIPVFTPPEVGKMMTPFTEGDILVHGMTVWPAPPGSYYSYQDIWSAYQFWECINKNLPGESQADHARLLQQSCMFISGYAPDGWFTAFRKILAAQSSNPESVDSKCQPELTRTT